MERRALERIVVPDSTVHYKQTGSSIFFKREIGPLLLINLNKSGACFEARQELEIRNQISLKIRIHGEKVLNLKGQVRWYAPAKGQERVKVGIQFLPFGKSRNYNSLQTLNRLREIQERYQS